MSFKNESASQSPSFIAEGKHDESEALANNAGDIAAIHVENLSKCYQIYARPQDRLKQSIYPRLQGLVRRPAKIYYHEFWALKDISFTVKKGETVGIIGRNGSGKSTLLQIICGTLNATSGTVKTHGRIAALLELGSGFNPEFTGRENVYMNGAVLGLTTEEIDSRYDSIAAFADIGNFIERPVKTYSSGMMVRLAFAVQAQVEPDILIVDEALAVGDAKFQVKCFDCLRKLKENGTSILLVTHSSEQIVTHCSRAILLNDGEQLMIGKPIRLVNRYMDLLFGKERNEISDAPVDNNKLYENGSEAKYNLSSQADIFSTRLGYNPHEYRWGDGSVAILDYYMGSEGEPYPSSIATGQRIHLAVSIRFLSDLIRPILGVTIKTKEGITVYGTNTELLAHNEFQNSGRAHTSICAELEFSCRLASGDYFISLGIATRQGEDITPHDRRYDSIHLQVRPNNTFFGLTDLGLSINTVQITT